jgi:hypothetical protein
MSKVHFCKKYVDNVLCGERDSDKFEKGRYSICKECKKREIRLIQKKKSGNAENVLSIESIIKEESLKDTVLKIPLYNGDTIMENFKSVIDSIDNLRIKHNDSANILNLSISIFQKSQNELQKKYDDLKIKYEELMKYCVDIRTYLLENKSGNLEPYVPKGSITD